MHARQARAVWVNLALMEASVITLPRWSVRSRGCLDADACRLTSKLERHSPPCLLCTTRTRKRDLAGWCRFGSVVLGPWLTILATGHRLFRMCACECVHAGVHAHVHVSMQECKPSKKKQTPLSIPRRPWQAGPPSHALRTTKSYAGCNGALKQERTNGRGQHFH